MRIDATSIMLPRPPQGHHKDDTVRKEHPSTRRIRELCLSCPLPVCEENSRDCAVSAVIKCNGSGISRRRREVQASRHGERITAYLRRNGGDTCPGIAAALKVPEGAIYTAVTSLIIDQGAPIAPTGLRDRCAIYQLQEPPA